MKKTKQELILEIQRDSNLNNEQKMNKIRQIFNDVSNCVYITPNCKHYEIQCIVL